MRMLVFRAKAVLSQSELQVKKLYHTYMSLGRPNHMSVGSLDGLSMNLPHTEEVFVQ